jgi:hypothetical protein
MNCAAAQVHESRISAAAAARGRKGLLLPGERSVRLNRCYGQAATFCGRQAFTAGGPLHPGGRLPVRALTRPALRHHQVEGVPRRRGHGCRSSSGPCCQSRREVVPSWGSSPRRPRHRSRRTRRMGTSPGDDPAPLPYGEEFSPPPPKFCAVRSMVSVQEPQGIVIHGPCARRACAPPRRWSVPRQWPANGRAQVRDGELEGQARHVAVREQRAVRWHPRERRPHRTASACSPTRARPKGLPAQEPSWKLVGASETPRWRWGST